MVARYNFELGSLNDVRMTFVGGRTVSLSPCSSMRTFPFHLYRGLKTVAKNISETF